MVQVDLRPQALVVLDQDLAPPPIAKALEMGGRVDDVGEQERGEPAVRLLLGRQGEQPAAGELVRLDAFIAEYPRIVAGRDLVDVARGELGDRAVVRLNVEAAREDAGRGAGSRRSSS